MLTDGEKYEVSGAIADDVCGLRGHKGNPVKLECPPTDEYYIEWNGWNMSDETILTRSIIKKHGITVALLEVTGDDDICDWIEDEVKMMELVLIDWIEEYR